MDIVKATGLETVDEIRDQLEDTGVESVDSTDDGKEDSDNESTGCGGTVPKRLTLKFLEFWPPGEGSGGGRQ